MKSIRGGKKNALRDIGELSVFTEQARSRGSTTSTSSTMKHRALSLPVESARYEYDSLTIFKNVYDTST